MEPKEITNLGEIFGKIGGIRQKEMIKRIKAHAGAIPDIKKALENSIEAEEYDCLGRGTETTGFDNHCRVIALLLKARNTIKRLENK